MQRPTLFTIGYEGASYPAFSSAIGEAGIELLVDVRELPLSRKRGFSKNALRASLSECGIGYMHLRALGDPKDGRSAARMRDYAAFQEIYAAHLRRSDAKEALVELRQLIKRQPSCLLCFEADPATCHRSIVASLIAKIEGMAVVHLMIDRSPVGERYRGNARAREGLATT